MSQPLANRMNETVDQAQQALEKLGTQDFASVGRELIQMIEEKMLQNPYQTLATALGIGVGLGALTSTQVKGAAIHFSKLVAMKTLSDLEARSQSDGSAGAVKS